jgi:hypothetical protein
MFKLHRLVPSALLLFVGGALWADEPLKLPMGNANHRLANVVASELKQGGMLRNYHIDVTCVDGKVELSGTVADVGQRAAAVRLVQNVAGVVSVKDSLRARDEAPVVRAQFGDLAQAQPTTPPKPAETLPPPAPTGDAPTDPLPSFRALPGQAPQGHGPGAGMNAPMPPYAWPTYGAYNNYSRVAYPVAYPNNAFPYVGPIHPFPKVPLGWRKVTLEWDDGHWWLATHCQPHDWWVLRFW